MYRIFGAFAVLTVAAMRDFASEAAVTRSDVRSPNHSEAYATEKDGYGFAAGAPPNGSGFSDRR